MRIVHVLTRLLRAGSEENTISSCIWQAKHGHDVIVVHGPDPDPYWQKNFGDQVSFVEVPDLVHPIHPLKDLKAIRAMRELFRGLEPDVIHTHQSKAGIIGRFAAKVVPDALVVHGIHIVAFEQVGQLKKNIYIAAEKLAARYTDLFIAVSRSVGQAYIDEGICKHVEPVYSGMPLENFRNAQPPEDWPELLGVPADTTEAARPKVILMVAAYETRKRHRAFLQALKPVLAETPNVQILFAGRGPVEDDVRAAVREFELQDHVTLCGFRNDPYALMALADVCVLTSEREGLPRVVVQYVATGTPVVVSDLPGLEEIVKDGVNGLVTDAHDLSDTADKLKQLLNTPDQLAKLAEGARATDVSEWELERLGQRTTALYEQTRAHLSQKGAGTAPKLT
ncbi:glycosyltransferase [Epibacterium ulvae]|uniref:glycosyltransferase n=1 Tax=Epibacterium ulvae TaxID=1156985 RepID=UPI002492F282|nr:glycosyltransferase [Epibacterium ulvae]